MKSQIEGSNDKNILYYISNVSINFSLNLEQ
jgi:hypothetical protein